MAVITPEIKEFIKNNLGWITTVSKDGELDLGPKMSLFVLDITHIFTAVFGDERPSRLRNLHAAILGVVLR